VVINHGCLREKIIDQYGRFSPRKWLPDDVLWSSSMLYELWSSYHYWPILIVLLCQYVYHINSCAISYSITHSYENLGMTSLYSVYKTHLWTATHFWGVVPGSPGSICHRVLTINFLGKPWFIKKAGQLWTFLDQLISNISNPHGLLNQIPWWSFIVGI